MTPDRELLRRFSEGGDEAAFAELVHRHLPVVYAAALRLLSGNAELAKDVAQEVFTDLARKGRRLSTHPTLVGWLHTSTRFRASKAIRAESRRQTREQEASLMTDHPTSPVTSDLPWEQLRPKLDEALGQLSETDRNAILLRFFQDKSFTEVAAILDLSESVAHKRVERAMEKMRGYFARSGFTGSVALLATTLDAQTIAPLPANLAVQVTENALAKTTLTTAATGAGLIYTFWQAFFMSTKIKIGLAIIVVILGAWWFLQSAPSHVKVTSTIAKPGIIPESNSALDPKSPALHPPPSMPMVIPTAKTGQSPSPPLLPSTEPQAELKTALPDMARMTRTKGMFAMCQIYALPDDSAQISPEDIQSEQFAMVGSPHEQKMIEAMAQAFDFLAGQTPTYNASGDEATYPATEGIPDDRLVMVKINGKWYIKHGLD